MLIVQSKLCAVLWLTDRVMEDVATTASLADVVEERPELVRVMGRLAPVWPGW